MANKYMQFSRAHFLPPRIPLLERTPGEEVHHDELEELALLHESYLIHKGSQRGVQSRKRSIGGERCGF